MLYRTGVKSSVCFASNYYLISYKYVARGFFTSKFLIDSGDDKTLTLVFVVLKLGFIPKCVSDNTAVSKTLPVVGSLQTAYSKKEILRSWRLAEHTWV